MKSTVRSGDNGGEYKGRRLWNAQTIIVLIGALAGGSITGVGVKFYNTNEVNQTPARLELIEERMSSYVESHAREEALSNQLLQQSLANIKEDLVELKDENEVIHEKLDEVKRLIRDGRPSPP